MADSYYPTIDTSILEGFIMASSKMPKKLTVGKSTVFVESGSKAIHKRNTIMRELTPGQISFEMATNLAIRFNCMRELLEWYEHNKQWKDGGYTEVSKMLDKVKNN